MSNPGQPYILIGAESDLSGVDLVDCHSADWRLENGYDIFHFMLNVFSCFKLDQVIQEGA